MEREWSGEQSMEQEWEVVKRGTERGAGVGGCGARNRAWMTVVVVVVAVQLHVHAGVLSCQTATYNVHVLTCPPLGHFIFR